MMIDGLNTEEPWTGKTYLFLQLMGDALLQRKEVHGDGVYQLVKGQSSICNFGLEDYLKNGNLEIYQRLYSLLLTTEMIRTCPEMWDFPVCVPTDRANLIHGKKFECLESPISWGYFIYLPEISIGFNQTERFKISFHILVKSLLINHLSWKIHVP